MKTVVAILIAFLLAPISGIEATRLRGQNQTGSLACNLYEDGLRRMERGEYVEALKSFDSVARSCPSNNLKAEALLRAGQIYLSQTPPNLVLANEKAQTISAQLGQTPAAAGASILSGRIQLAEGRANDEIDTALAAFARAISVTVPGGGEPSQRIAEAAYYSGEALRLAHRHQDALEQYRQVLLRYPDSIWTARALLGTAQCYARIDQHGLAMAALQQVRRRFANTAESELALNWNTILYRLHLRTSGEAPFQYVNRTLGDNRSKFRDGVGVLFDRQGRVVVAHRDGWSVFSPAGERIVRADQRDFLPSAVGLVPDGAIAIAREQVISIDREGDLKVHRPMIPRTSGQPKPPKVLALIATWRGEWLVADRETMAVLRFSASFDYGGVFANVGAARLAVSDIDDIAALDIDKHAVIVLDRAGSKIAEIGPQGAGYRLAAPVDVAFDALANLYVLDNETKSVYIFDPSMKFIKTFQAPAKGAGALRDPSAIGIDAAGRLYVFDKDGQRVLVYQ